MKTHLKITLISLVLISSMIAAGCQANTAAQTTSQATNVSVSTDATLEPTRTAHVSTATVVQASDTPTTKPTHTTAPSETSDPEGTPQTTATAAVQSSATATALKKADFGSTEFFTGGALANWQYFIALQFDGYITGEYYAVVDKNKDYKCEILAMYPNRLYCHGPQAAFMDYVRFEVFDANTNEKVFEDRIWVPGTYYNK